MGDGSEISVLLIDNEGTGEVEAYAVPVGATVATLLDQADRDVCSDKDLILVDGKRATGSTVLTNGARVSISPINLKNG